MDVPLFIPRTLKSSGVDGTGIVISKAICDTVQLRKADSGKPDTHYLGNPGLILTPVYIVCPKLNGHCMLTYSGSA